jgi:hypothetical protein
VLTTDERGVFSREKAQRTEKGILPQRAQKNAERAGKFNHGIPGIRGKRQKPAGEGKSLNPCSRAVLKRPEYLDEGGQDGSEARSGGGWLFRPGELITRELCV